MFAKQCAVFSLAPCFSAGIPLMVFSSVTFQPAALAGNVRTGDLLRPRALKHGANENAQKEFSALICVVHPVPLGGDEVHISVKFVKLLSPHPQPLSQWERVA